MIWVDFFLVGVLLLSMGISIWRGFVKEALSLASWILAFWIALTFTDTLANLIGDNIETPSLRYLTSFVAIFVVMLVAGAMLNHFAGVAVKRTGLGGTDRLVGIFFGLARGIVVLGGLVMLGTLLELDADPWWDDSRLIPYVEPVAQWLRGFLPETGV